MGAGKAVISLVSVLLIVGVVIGVVVVLKNNHGGGQNDSKGSGSSTTTSAAVTTSSKTATTICQVTDYKDICIKSLGDVANNESATPKDYLNAILHATMAEFNKSLGVAHSVKVDEKNEYENSGLEDCKKCLQFAVEDLEAAISMVRENDFENINKRIFDLQNWFTALLSYKGTCLDEVQLPEYRTPIENGLINATQLTSNALYILDKLDDILAGMGINLEVLHQKDNVTTTAPAAATNRRLLEVNELGHDGYPTWLSAGDRKLLAAFERKGGKWGKHGKGRRGGRRGGRGGRRGRRGGKHGKGGKHGRRGKVGLGGAIGGAVGGTVGGGGVGIALPVFAKVPGVGLAGGNPSTYAGPLKPNAVVAQDGSSQFKTINDAVNAIPNAHPGKWVIYVKAGIYQEHVIIPSTKSDVFMYGDGPTKTIVTGKLSQLTNTKTMQSATFSVEGPRFIGKGMGFRNTAGPEGHQAVAFRSKSDMSAMFDCRFEAYQDTLYYHANRQFYKNCVIAGTVDFLFGQSSRTLIQDSDIIVRMPMANQKNTITADGCDHTKAVAGLVIQGCHIMPEKSLFENKAKTPTFLGRPWMPTSFTAIAQTKIEDFIDPAGYMEWDGKEKTATYVEFFNEGVGGKQARTCGWKKLRINNNGDAQIVTPAFHLEGGPQPVHWVPQTGVPVYMGLKGR